MTNVGTTISTRIEKNQVREALEVLRRLVSGSPTIGPAQVLRNAEMVTVAVTLRGDQVELALGRIVEEATEIAFDVRMVRLWDAEWGTTGLPKS